MSGWEMPTPTTATSEAVRLALSAGLLTLLEMGGSGSCSLKFGPEPVVRFSHESAEACSLDSAIVASLAEENIVIQRGDGATQSGVLLMVFPGS